MWIMSCRSRNHQSSCHLNFQPTKTTVCGPFFPRRNVVGFFLKLDTPATPRKDLAIKVPNLSMGSWKIETVKLQRVTLEIFPWTNAGNLTYPAKKGGFELVNALIISLFVAKVSSTLRVWPRGWFSRCLDASAGLPSKYGGVLQHFAGLPILGLPSFCEKKGWPFWMIVPGDHL